MSEVSAANRRIHSRRSVRLPARLTHRADAVDGTIENIGEGGVFFATHNLEIDVEEGAAGIVSFRCFRQGVPETVERSGTILRAERYFDGEAVVRAFALKFDSLLQLDGIEFA
jgi:hypothetical protein